MRYLTVFEILTLHAEALNQSGGAERIRDLGGIESAVSQCAMTFGGQELYPTLTEKAVALCFSLVMNHPFLDGNKRVGHFTMETLLVLNGKEIDASVDEQEELILRLAQGNITRDELAAWLSENVEDFEIG